MLSELAMVYAASSGLERQELLSAMLYAWFGRRGWSALLRDWMVWLMRHTRSITTDSLSYSSPVSKHRPTKTTPTESMANISSKMKTQRAHPHPRPHSRLLFHSILLPGTSTPRPPPTTPTLPAPPRSTTGTRSTRSPSFPWRWPHKRKINRKCLIEQLCAVGAIDGGTGFAQGGVFY